MKKKKKKVVNRHMQFLLFYTQAIFIYLLLGLITNWLTVTGVEELHAPLIAFTGVKELNAPSIELIVSR